jgi:hypothetical protein
MNKCYWHIWRLCHISVSRLLLPKNSDAIINLNQQHLSLNISVLIPVENQRSVTVTVTKYGIILYRVFRYVSETNIILCLLSVSERNFYRGYSYATWCHVGLSLFHLLHKRVSTGNRTELQLIFKNWTRLTKENRYMFSLKRSKWCQQAKWGYKDTLKNWQREYKEY